LAAALVQLVGYGAYARLLLRGDIVANPTSWSLWALGSIIEVFAYGAVTHDMAKLALPAACCAASIVIAAVTLFQARFSRPDLTDVGAALMDVGVILIWVFSHNADLTYVWFLVDVLLTFAPIIRSTYSHPEDEQALPWVVWTVAYGLLFAACLLRWEGVETLLLPAIYVMCHLTVGVLAIRRWGDRHGQSANPKTPPRRNT
jgi:hypothetical protein